MQRADLRAPRIRARYDLSPRRHDPSDVAGEDRPRTGRSGRPEVTGCRRKRVSRPLRKARAGRPAETGEDHRRHSCRDARCDHLRQGRRPRPGEYRRAWPGPPRIAARPPGTGRADRGLARRVEDQQRDRAGIPAPSERGHPHRHPALLRRHGQEDLARLGREYLRLAQAEGIRKRENHGLARGARPRHQWPPQTESPPTV